MKKRNVGDDILDANGFVDIDFEVSTSKSIEMTDEEIVESILSEDMNQDEVGVDNDEVEAYDTPPRKPKLSELEEVFELMERWSLFDGNGVEIRKQLNIMSRTCQKHYIDCKKQRNMSQFLDNTPPKTL